MRAFSMVSRAWNLRLFGFGLAQWPVRALPRPLQGPANLDVALCCFQAGGLALTLDIERLPFGFEIAGADLIIESCSMSLRSLRLASMFSINWVRPSASKRFDGLKNSRSV